MARVVARVDDGQGSAGDFAFLNGRSVLALSGLARFAENRNGDRAAACRVGLVLVRLPAENGVTGDFQPGRQQFALKGDHRRDDFPVPAGETFFGGAEGRHL